MFFTRDLVSEPANVLYPVEFARRARQQLTKVGVKVEILGEAEMKKLGMNVLLAVGQGSARESQLLVMSWMNGPKGQAPVALVGKGVCFDTGGISMKPAGGMEDMKWDMGGAGAVTGAMRLLAARKARANVIGICALVENMPDGNAQRPGDVVDQPVGPDGRGDQHRRRGPADPVRRDVVRAGEVQAAGDGRALDPDRRDHRLAGP